MEMFRVMINGDRINGMVISPTYEWGINWGYNPLTNLGGGNSNMFWNVHPDLWGK